ncbi:SDR family NAD(P)-dependent oxidoreductase [Actinosynnema sp. NPDC047251]|uniref:NAD-dependent epimerase/dehydratase n=1 Tax=Saccharothrix espanaensis (strain ATCC 51144 / DSM 44229 / JCM 9112 / NBRC 15066 / NRRL 15764) TaxID=1179773 RepID=K0JYL0_SACES|nr:SDR family NAD(P)-dependent oxidoreductase [Saccharothrix espanaensis]CCH31221.1 NAD-dependent epimerase/dehydratase [Saccharothrix espanaensis DSM 44229]
MLVTVTGGSGFVGAHTVAELVRAGHRVRVLARSESTVDSALRPLGVPAVEVVAGDVTDERSVEPAVRGADAVVHCASVYSFDRRRREEMVRTNVRGTEVVLGAALRAGVGRVVHVSSIAALFGPGVRVIGEQSPLGTSREPYAATKSGSDAVARRHQERGAPVVISYPPALLGPHDPKIGDQTSRLRDLVRGLMPMWPAGGLQLGDVRDTAALHAALLAPDVTGRHFGPGRYLTTAEYVRAVRAATGRALPAVFLPAAAMLPVGRLADLVQPWWPWHIPAEHGAIATVGAATRVDPAASTLGLAPRPFANTVADTVRWLAQTGVVTPRQAGG